MEKPTPDSAWVLYAKYSAVGFQIVVSLMVLTWVGTWLDKRFGLYPWGTVTGLFLGGATGLSFLFRLLSFKKPKESS